MSSPSPSGPSESGKNERPVTPEALGERGETDHKRPLPVEYRELPKLTRVALLLFGSGLLIVGFIGLLLPVFPQTLPLAVADDGRTLVRIDPRYFRPSEVDLLLGDASLARKDLGWEPKVTFAELVRLMADADLREAGSGVAADVAPA